jgi:hypothetical protein
MIYILQETQKTKKKTQHKLLLSESKKFLYDLDQSNFISNKFYVFSADTDNEIKKLLNYFNDDFLIKTNYNGFEAFIVNPSIKKTDRLSTKGARVSSIQSFVSKINVILPEYIPNVYFENENFHIILKKFGEELKIICSYDLEIERFLGKNTDDSYVDLIDHENVYSKINELFRNQRYYYRKKGK